MMPAGWPPRHARESVEVDLVRILHGARVHEQTAWPACRVEEEGVEEWAGENGTAGACGGARRDAMQSEDCGRWDTKCRNGR